tara:strand:- start:4385 stop:5818 length:1434 start_codon:yes stop_codon:yes gene_type:complete
MAISIDQKPLFNVFPVGQQVIFAVSDSNAATSFNFKYIADVYISTGTSISTLTTTDFEGTFKTTPNNSGVGIFDLGPFLESYVSPQNEGRPQSRYKNIVSSLATPHPIHLIDKFCTGKNPIRLLAIMFRAEGSTTATDPVQDLNIDTSTGLYYFFNGVLQHNNYLTQGEVNAAGIINPGFDYGYDLSANNFYPGEAANGKFLTNAPFTQYANIDDYGTVAFLNRLPDATDDKITKINFEYFKKDGSTVTEAISQNWTSGGQTNLDSAAGQFLYAGVFPGNLRNWSATFRALVTDDTLDYYTFKTENVDGEDGQLYTIRINCPSNKGYESVRLTWLNQWGAWDYYTFTQKSVKSLTTNRTTYTQLDGTWNESYYKMNGYKGGRKNFRVNSTERIKVNTDFVNEADAVWFEELINSPEVYILNGFDSTESAPYNTITNKYVEPVLITTSDYTRKTVGNDRLIQYTFDMERNKTKKIQST